MAARNFFGRTLFMCSFQGKSRFYEIFSCQKSLFVLLAKEKDTCRSAYVVRTRKFYSFYVRAAIDREVRGLDYEIPETKPCTRLLLYLFWPAFHVALVYLIHRWPMLEKMTKTQSVPILVAIKVVLRRKDA